jgi:hypothetical protein
LKTRNLSRSVNKVRFARFRTPNCRRAAADLRRFRAAAVSAARHHG